MGDAGDSQVKHAISDPSPIPQAHPVKLEYDTSQCASYVSQRSSSIETFGSHSPTEGTEDKVSVQGKQNIISSTAGSGEASEDQQCIRNDESMPSSLLNPAHQSTPLKDCTYMSTPADETGESLPAENSLAVEEHEVFLPGDLQTPILGYETMEARSRFTVYKIQVQKQTSDSSSWFVFRRYSDFLHLNERLRHLFPGFRLSLPPKRWFRDNFDQNFLEDRVLGLQTFLNNIIGHKDICNSAPVRGFLCTDEPPGPHDSLEESRAFCDTLEESVYALHQQLQDKQIEIDLLKEQVSLLSDQVRVLKGMLPAEANDSKASSINGRSVRVTAVPRVPTPIEVLLKSDIPNTESQEQSMSSGVDEGKKEGAGLSGTN